MTAAAILFVSALAFLLFLVTYCRSLAASAAHHALSKEIQDVVGIRTSPSPQDFVRLTQLLRLLPNQSERQISLRVVGLYYSMLSSLEATVAHLSPSVGAWAERERVGCAQFAALVLDRQILALQAIARQARS